MAEAKVTEIGALDDFRVDLVNCSLAVRRALTDILLEIRRAMDWITEDRAVFWAAEVRRSSDLLARAKDELAHSRTFKSMGNYIPSCAEEKKQVELAKRRLEHAEKKVEMVRHWARAAQIAIDEFQGPVQQLNGMLDGDIPHAIALLERMSRALEVYANGQIPTAISWDELVNLRAKESMAQPVEEADEPNAAKQNGARDRSTNGAGGHSELVPGPRASDSKGTAS
ncbi:MAG TPA: hypothetical protein VGI75_06370 [Pirellulales bacterium]